MRKLIPFFLLLSLHYKGHAHGCYDEIYYFDDIPSDILAYHYDRDEDIKLKHYCAEGHSCEAIDAEASDPASEEYQETSPFTVSPELERVLNALDKYRQ